MKAYAVYHAEGKSAWFCHECGEAWNDGDERCKCSGLNSVLATNIAIRPLDPSEIQGKTQSED